MNDGVITLITQWCLLCLIWMGMFDRALGRIALTRSHGLAVVTLFLICSYANWQLYFLPVSINLSGAILPLLTAAWIWSALHPQHKGFVLLAALFTTFLLFATRKLFFWDPVLMIVDEPILLPLIMVGTLFLLAREWRQQLVILFLSLPLADAVYMISSFQQWERCIIGGEYAQDLMWSILPLWLMFALLWRIMTKGLGVFRTYLTTQLKWKTKTNANR